MCFCSSQQVRSTQATPEANGRTLNLSVSDEKSETKLMTNYCEAIDVNGFTVIENILDETQCAQWYEA